MAEKILAKDLENDLMLYDTECDDVHVLNPTAKLIYNLVTAGKDIDEIEKELRAHFTIDETHDLRNDIRNYLDKMHAMGLIETLDTKD
jgi:hypothetical protein